MANLLKQKYNAYRLTYMGIDICTICGQTLEQYSSIEVTDSKMATILMNTPAEILDNMMYERIILLG